MRFVILSACEIPGFGGVKGPILNPQPLDLNVVRQLVSLGIDVREVMDDDSYRKIGFNDGRILEAIDKGRNKILPEAYVPVIEQKEDYIEEEIKVSTIIKPTVSEKELDESLRFLLLQILIIILLLVYVQNLLMHL